MKVRVTFRSPVPLSDYDELFGNLFTTGAYALTAFKPEAMLTALECDLLAIKEEMFEDPYAWTKL